MENAVNKMIKINPNDFYTLVCKGLLHSFKKEYQQAEEMGNQLLEKANKKKSKKWQICAFDFLLMVCFNQNDLEKAQKILEESVKLFSKRDYKKIADAYYNIGRSYRESGELEKAEKIFKKVLEIEGETGRAETKIVVYANLGRIAEKQGDSNKAEEMYKKALNIAEKINDQEKIGVFYGSLGLLFKERGDLENAEEMLKKALEIYEKTGDYEGMANEYGNIGNIYLERDELDKAEEMYNKVLDIEKNLGQPDSIATTYGNLGIIYKKKAIRPRQLNTGKRLKIYMRKWECKMR